MNNYVIMAFAATLGTWFVTALGAAAVVFCPSADTKPLNRLLGFASGVMLAASFWSLLQPAVCRAREVSALPAGIAVTGGFLLGAVFLWGSDRALSMLRQKTPGSGDGAGEGLHRVLMLLFSITLHNIPEGLAVGVAFGALKEGGPETLAGAVSVAVGIGLQNFPEGAAVSLPLRREGYSRRRSFLLGQASALVEPVAGVLGAVLVVRVEALLPYALSFAAGAMILVAVHELIPECQQDRERRSYRSTAGIIGGFALMTLLDVLLG